MAPKGTAFTDKKRRGEKIVVVTAYDAPTAQAAAEVGVDIILVGDSVGAAVLGYAHEREVTLSDMSHHIAAARRGAPDAYIIGDLPYATYETQAQAIASARSLRDAGANCVKFEGARAELVRALKAAEIDVCGHIGLESQHHEQKRRQGKTAQAALKLLEEARALDDAGQDFIVLELIPEEVSATITRAIKAPTIGIGSGAQTDGQVLVVNDLAGITRRDFKHNRRYGALGDALRSALAAYAADVRSGSFPGPEHAFRLSAEERKAFDRAVAEDSRRHA